MTEDEDKTLTIEIAQLRQEHTDLDAAIAAMVQSSNSDPLQVQRLKKRKLYLKDKISALEDQLTPDIIA